MRRAADVKSIDALRDAKAAVVEFRETAGVALSEATSEVQRVASWLQNEKRTYWEHEIRRRREKVAQAKSELYRAKLAAMDPTASCLDQKKQLERAERALAEAECKGANVRRWARDLEREIMLFKGKLQALARSVDADLPRGEARLELLMDKLESYVRLAAPAASGSSRVSTAADDAGDSGPAPAPAENDP